MANTKPWWKRLNDAKKKPKSESRTKQTRRANSKYRADSVSWTGSFRPGNVEQPWTFMTDEELDAASRGEK